MKHEQLQAIIDPNFHKAKELEARVQTLEERFASLQEANTRLERERDEAEDLFMKISHEAVAHRLICRDGKRHRFCEAINPLKIREKTMAILERRAD